MNDSNNAFDSYLDLSDPKETMLNIFRMAIEQNASDLHLTADMPPVLRIKGELVRASLSTLSSDYLKTLIYGVLTDEQIEEFEREFELDLSVDLNPLGRFRANIHYQRGHIEAAFRLIPPTIKSLEELRLPETVGHLAMRRSGLILITGPTGSGKTTTMATMLDIINQHKKSVVVTIEDPIEYTHENKQCIIKQRELHSDTKSFHQALVHTLRQDPDVISVGEMRDLDTISTAITAAETGHLVLATLHTQGAPETINRIIDVFPPYQQQQARIQLAECLRGIISQQLLPTADEKSQVVACEILVATHGVRNLIREQTTDQLHTLMETNASRGMITMDHSIKMLLDDKLISYDTAMTYAKYPEYIHSTTEKKDRKKDPL